MNKIFINLTFQKIATIGILLQLIFTRYYMLGRDIVNRDAYHFKNWSYVFMKEFEAHNWDALFVSIQPGVLTIYSNIIGFKLLYFLKDKLGIFDLNGQELELMLHIFQKVPQTTFIILLSIGMFYLVSKIFNFYIALIFLIIYIYEPLFILHTRVIQTDALQSVLMLVSVLLAIYFLETKKMSHFVLSGIFGGLAFIEKSPSILLIPIIGIILFIDNFLSTKNVNGTNISNFFFKLFSSIKKSLNYIFLYILIFLLTTYITFPAFWFHPISSLRRMTVDAYVFGVEGYNTENYTYDKYVTSGRLDPAYLYTFAYKHSEIFLIGIFLFATYCIAKFFDKKRSNKKALVNRKNNVYLIILSLVYFLMLQISEKKFGRYLIITTLPLFILSAQGFYYSLLELSKKVVGKIKAKIFNNLLTSEVVFLSAIFLMSVIGISTYLHYMPDIGAHRNSFASKNNYYDTAGGTGSYLLAKYITEKYGKDRKILISDYTSLLPFYDGNVVDYSEDKIGGKDYIIILDHQNNENLSKFGYTVTDSFETKGNVNFYFYENTDL